MIININKKARAQVLENPIMYPINQPIMRELMHSLIKSHFTVTLFARFLGLSGSAPLNTAS